MIIPFVSALLLVSTGYLLSSDNTNRNKLNSEYKLTGMCEGGRRMSGYLEDTKEKHPISKKTTFIERHIKVGTKEVVSMDIFGNITLEKVPKVDSVLEKNDVKTYISPTVQFNTMNNTFNLNLDEAKVYFTKSRKYEQNSITKLEEYIPKNSKVFTFGRMNGNTISAEVIGNKNHVDDHVSYKYYGVSDEYTGVLGIMMFLSAAGVVVGIMAR